MVSNVETSVVLEPKNTRGALHFARPYTSRRTRVKYRGRAVYEEKKGSGYGGFKEK